jgi:hypothetical protein
MRIYYPRRTEGGRHATTTYFRNIVPMGNGYVPLLLSPGLGANDNQGVHFGDGLLSQPEKKKELEAIGEKLKNLKLNSSVPKRRNVTFSF